MGNKRPCMSAVPAEKTESPGEEIDTEALHCGADIPTPKSYSDITARGVVSASLSNGQRAERQALEDSHCAFTLGLQGPAAFPSRLAYEWEARTPIRVSSLATTPTVLTEADARYTLDPIEGQSALSWTVATTSPVPSRSMSLATYTPLSVTPERSTIAN